MGAQDIIGAITGGLNQSDRLLRLDTTLGSNVLVPQRVVGHSRIGRHFEFTVDAVSASGTVELKTLIAQAVKGEILLTSGGAYIRLKDGNIEIHAPGKINVKGAQHSFNGPTLIDEKFPAWNDSVPRRAVDFSG